MEIRTAMDKIPEKLDSKFRYVLLASQRAEQLIKGARPKTDSRNRKPTVMAMREVDDSLVGWDYGPAPVPEPVETEVTEAEAEAEVEAEPV